MEFEILSYLFLSSFIIFFIFFQNSKPKQNLPPGPRKLPIIGNLHLLAGSDPLHRTLKTLSNKHGPLMHLQLGEIDYLIASSPDTAEQFMKTHDVVFANRPSILATEIGCYNNTDIAFSPYGDYWKQLRIICKLELLGPNPVQSFRFIREEEVSTLCKWLARNAGTSVSLSGKLSSTNFDIMVRAAFGEKNEEQAELIDLIKGSPDFLSVFSVVDVYPSIRFLRVFSGIKRKIEERTPSIEKVDTEKEDAVEEESESLTHRRTTSKKRVAEESEQTRTAKKGKAVKRAEIEEEEEEAAGSSEDTDFLIDNIEEGQQSENPQNDEEPSHLNKKLSFSEATPAKTLMLSSAVTVASTKEGMPPVKKIIVPKTVEVSSMERLGIWSEMQGYFENIGWGPFLQWKGIIYGDLVREFTRNMTSKNPAKVGLTTPCLHVKIEGKELHLSVNDVNLAVGMAAVWDLQQSEYQEAYKRVPDQSVLEIQERWRLIGKTPEFRSGYTKGHELKSEGLRLCHRVLAYNFYGKENNSNSISQKELFILWCMETGKRVNFGAFAIAQLQEINKTPRSKITLGHFITELAKSMRVLSVEKTTMTPVPEEMLDIACLHRMMEIVTSDNGDLQFVSHESKEKKEDAEQAPETAVMSNEVLNKLLEVEGIAIANRHTLGELTAEVKKIREILEARYAPGSPAN